MKVLILAAGYATRLYPLTENTPKPLLPIAGRPMIDHILDKVQPLTKVDEIFVVTNNKFEKHFQEWASQKKFPIKITIVNDGTKSNDDRLGSVGDIHFAIKAKNITDGLLVLGGDNLFDYSLIEFLKVARLNVPIATIGLYDIHDLKQATIYGVAQIDDTGKIISFEEKPAQPKSTLIAMCFYYFPQATLGCLDEYIKKSGKLDKAGDYIRWLSEEKGVYGFKFSGKWYDIGDLESYKEAQENFR